MDAQKFHDTLVQEFNLQAYSPQEQTQYIDQLSELVLQGVLLKAFSAISDEQADQMEQSMQQGMSPEQMMQMLQSMIPGFSELVKDEVMQVKRDLATATQSSEETPSSGADSIFG